MRCDIQIGSHSTEPFGSSLSIDTSAVQAYGVYQDTQVPFNESLWSLRGYLGYNIVVGLGRVLSAFRRF